ncbi:hypothetical protein [Bdellovibrio bacteriovorus]|uniref:hypothetical protein n=1 Tax=Bdellovibrio bacteriovorus TaxID=959 RepID=UPI0035A70998
MFLKCLPFLFLSSLCSAATLSPVLREGSTRFLSRSLGSACYTLDSVQRGLPCNPAAIAKERKPRFDLDLFLGSDIQNIKDSENLLNGHDEEGTVARLLARRDSIDGEISLEASFQSSNWGVSVEPYRLVSITRIENPALPMMDMVIAEEKSVKGQIGSYVYDNFYAGLQLRYTHVKFIGEYFAISEAFAGDKAELFSTRTQELFYVEPGFLYAWENLAWQPQISAMLSQWGVTSEKSDEYPITPQGLLGASVKPLVPLGLFEVGIQFEVNSETKNARDAFRAAFSYQLGILQAVLSVSEYDHSAGFLVGYKHFTGGLTYWSEQERESRAVFIQLGATL